MSKDLNITKSCRSHQICCWCLLPLCECEHLSCDWLCVTDCVWLTVCDWVWVNDWMSEFRLRPQLSTTPPPCPDLQRCRHHSKHSQQSTLPLFVCLPSDSFFLITHTSSSHPLTHTDSEIELCVKICRTITRYRDKHACTRSSQSIWPAAANTLESVSH